MWKKILILCLILLLLLVAGCSKEQDHEAFLLTYSDGTLFPKYTGEPLLNLNFETLSSETELDLAVFDLIGTKNSYQLNYPLTLAKDLATGNIYEINLEQQQQLLTLRDDIHFNIFGEYLDWDDVNQLFAMYNKVLVKDIDTQLYFQVQRRGGSSHVDVQPLTRLDTSVMLEVFNGEWSWHRRAVVLKVRDRFIAGSMNGMPHGAGAIRDNDFNGHFCIHFLNCVTHGNNNLDFAHQLMVKKSSGRLFDTLMEMPPEELIKAFIIFTTQEQSHLAKYILNDPNSNLSFFEAIESIQISSITRLIDEEKYKKLEVNASYFGKNLTQTSPLIFELHKPSNVLTWKIQFAE